MGHKQALPDLIRRARRRHLWNLILVQAVNAVCVVAAGLVVLLVAGTQVMDWPWLAGLLAAGAGAGVWLTVKRLPSPYAVAQAIDRRLGFEDAISTAFIFERTNRRASEDMRAAQYRQADQMASGVDLNRAAPFHAPRSLYVMAALGVLASGLLAIRYGMSERLDLRPNLAKIAFDSFFPPPEQRAAAKKAQKKASRFEEMLKQMGFSLDSDNQQGEAQNANANAISDPAEQQPPSSSEQPKPEGISVQAKNSRQGESGDESAEGAGQESMGENASAQSDPKSSQRSEPGKQQNASANSDMLDRFREALSNLLARMKNPPALDQGRQMASNSAGKQEGQQGQPRPGQQGAQQQGQGQQTSDRADGKAEGSQEGEGQQQAEGSKGKQGGGDTQRAARQGQSGIGKDDGSKDLKEAEQLAAMGKISELLGKRSENLTGEFMVEVQSGKQRLRTAYSNDAPAHAQSGGDIHRDEIPLAYQPYVQQYFEEVRKPGLESPKKK